MEFLKTFLMESLLNKIRKWRMPALTVGVLVRLLTRKKIKKKETKKLNVGCI